MFINLILSFIANQPGQPLGDFYPVPPGTPEKIGFFGTFAALGLWCSAGIVWAPLNAYGLFKKRAWARKSSLVYYAVSLFTCCCIPLGLYGLWSLSVKDIRPARPGGSRRPPLSPCTPRSWRCAARPRPEARQW